jgi:hypothetical protein
MRYNTHVCLVSDNITSNVTPVLEPSFRPEKVILIVAKNYGQYALWLKQVLQQSGVAIEEWHVEDAWDSAMLYEKVRMNLDREDTQGFALNVSCGTNSMNIAAYEAFRDYKLPIFYVHPDLDRLMWMYPHSHKYFDISDKIKLPSFFKLYGTEVTSNINRADVSDSHQMLMNELIENINYYEKALAKLNYVASKASDRRDYIVKLDDSMIKDKVFLELLDLLLKHEVVKKIDKSVQFVNKEARFFANGGWLEDYVYCVVSDLIDEIPCIQDLSRAVELQRMHKGDSIKNELDVVFLANNRLFLIECKTAKWEKSSADGKGAHAVYKIDTLKDVLGGIQAEAMIVSYQPLRANDRVRASDLNILTVSNTEIQSLKTIIKGWIK